MARIAAEALRGYLLRGQLSARGCLRNPHIRPRTPRPAASFHGTRPLHIEPTPTTNHDPAAPIVPLRKQLKDEAQKQKASGKKKKKNASNQVVDGWELTVGIEIHAQLNTAKKLFSAATTSFNDDPNTHVAYFDLAIPGSQPIFQKETLIPALRAALALDCAVQPVSRFDRKHYFHWDQPSGYQITQYYEPFARNGKITLQKRDGIAAEDGEGPITVSIQQVQMEQDTAKTTAQPDGVHWIDFNRTGVPLIEIITRPEIHHPATAAALVRKVQALLSSVDACVSGMEAGGLRADVNVSVRRRTTTDEQPQAAPLGQRTEIKNLSSFRAVEDAIIAERDRQIAVLEAGGTIAGETRGWTIGSTETRRLRGKEGEVDYRYMPDPDVGPVVIGSDLVSHLRDTMGQLPDAEIDELISKFALSTKDAMSLVSLDNGNRVEYFWNVISALESRLREEGEEEGESDKNPLLDTESTSSSLPCYQLAANWVLHELGRLTSDRSSSRNNNESDDHHPEQPATTTNLVFTKDGSCDQVPANHVADILYLIHTRKITTKVGKELLWVVFRGQIPDVYPTVRDAVEEEELWFRELSEGEYEVLADQAVEGQDKVIGQFVDAVVVVGSDNNINNNNNNNKGKKKVGGGGGGGGGKYPEGKLMFLVGRMVRLGAEERIDPKNAARVMRGRIEERYVPALLKAREEE